MWSIILHLNDGMQWCHAP